MKKMDFFKGQLITNKLTSIIGGIGGTWYECDSKSQEGNYMTGIRTDRTYDKNSDSHNFISTRTVYNIE